MTARPRFKKSPAEKARALCDDLLTGRTEFGPRADAIHVEPTDAEVMRGLTCRKLVERALPPQTAEETVALLTASLVLVKLSQPYKTCSCGRVFATREDLHRQERPMTPEETQRQALRKANLAIKTWRGHAKAHAAKRDELRQALEAATAENAKLREELARVQRLPELPWAEACASIMQRLASMARAGYQPDAQSLVAVLDQGKTYVGRLLTERDEARAEAQRQRTVIVGLREALGRITSRASDSFPTSAEAVRVCKVPAPLIEEGRAALTAAADVPAATEPRCERCQTPLRRGPIGGGHFDWLECKCAPKTEAQIRAAALEEAAQWMENTRTRRQPYDYAIWCNAVARELRALAASPAPKSCARCGGKRWWLVNDATDEHEPCPDCAPEPCTNETGCAKVASGERTAPCAYACERETDAPKPGKAGATK